MPALGATRRFYPIGLLTAVILASWLSIYVRFPHLLAGAVGGRDAYYYLLQLHRLPGSIIGAVERLSALWLLEAVPFRSWLSDSAAFDVVQITNLGVTAFLVAMCVRLLSGHYWPALIAVGCFLSAQLLRPLVMEFTGSLVGLPLLLVLAAVFWRTSVVTRPWLVAGILCIAFVSHKLTVVAAILLLVGATIGGLRSHRVRLICGVAAVLACFVATIAIRGPSVGGGMSSAFVPRIVFERVPSFVDGVALVAALALWRTALQEKDERAWWSISLLSVGFLWNPWLESGGGLDSPAARCGLFAVVLLPIVVAMTASAMVAAQRWVLAGLIIVAAVAAATAPRRLETAPENWRDERTILVSDLARTSPPLFVGPRSVVVADHGLEFALTYIWAIAAVHDRATLKTPSDEVLWLLHLPRSLSRPPPSGALVAPAWLMIDEVELAQWLATMTDGDRNLLKRENPAHLASLLGRDLPPARSGAKKH